MRCKVVIADDSAPVRRLCREMLGLDARIEVVAEAADGHEALAAVRAERPDVLVMDLAMPRMDGLQALLALRAEGLPTRVVVLSGYARDRLGPLILDSGAFAYLEKGVAAEVLCRTVLDAARQPARSRCQPKG